MKDYIDEFEEFDTSVREKLDDVKKLNWCDKMTAGRYITDISVENDDVVLSIYLIDGVYACEDKIDCFYVDVEDILNTLYDYCNENCIDIYEDDETQETYTKKYIELRERIFKDIEIIEDYIWEITHTKEYLELVDLLENR